MPPAPAGEGKITARVQVSTAEDAGQSGLPVGQVRNIAVSDIAADLPYPVYGASAALLPGEPGAGEEPPRAIALPESDGGMLNLAYAVQWFLFVPITVVGWVLLLRGEFRMYVPSQEAIVGNRPSELPKVHNSRAQRVPAPSSHRQQPDDAS